MGTQILYLESSTCSVNSLAHLIKPWKEGSKFISCGLGRKKMEIRRIHGNLFIYEM
jgi:hypothetical protein